MSVMTIPADLYRELLRDAYARYRKAGMEPTAALQRAHEIMQNCARCEDAVLQDELQRDMSENGIFS